MTQKDYVEIAKVIAEVRDVWHNDDTAELVIASLQAKLAYALKTDNPKFSFKQFNAACERTY